jgi:hypothetical protein
MRSCCQAAAVGPGSPPMKHPFVAARGCPTSLRAVSAGSPKSRSKIENSEPPRRLRRVRATQAPLHQLPDQQRDPSFHIRSWYLTPRQRGPKYHDLIATAVEPQPNADSSWA